MQYLLERDGLCAAGTGTTGGPTWTDTVVYRVGDHLVGIQVDSAATAAVLDRLFEGNHVEDPRAGHSNSIAFPSVADRTLGSGPPALNLLVQPDRATVHNRDPGHILRALLAHLHDHIVNTAGTADRRRVNAVAVGVHTADGWAAGLIPRNFLDFADRAGLDNCRFVEASFADIASDAGLGSDDVDVVVINGVYSWISAANQRQIAEVIRQRLRPGGFAFVMYGFRWGGRRCRR